MADEVTICSTTADPSPMECHHNLACSEGAGCWLHAPASEHLFTVKDVADASGLPQPAVGQLVERTWTDRGWMVTADQMQRAIDIAAERRQAPGGSR